MIFKSTSGTGITSTLRYVKGPGKDEHGKPKTADRTNCLGGTGFGFNPLTERQQDIARRLMEQNGRFDMQGSPTKQCIKDCQHISLSWAPGQAPDREEKLEAVRTFLKALGMENSMTLIYEHTDRSHPHIHMVSSRINPETGLTYDDYQQRYKGWHTSIEWEREHNQVTKARQWQHDLADATRGEPDRERLKDLLFKNEATVRKTKLDMALAFGGHFGPHLEAHREDFIRHHDLIGLKKYRDGRTAAYTTKEIYQEETQTLSRAWRLKDRPGYGVDEDTLKRFSDDLTLTDEQHQAAWHMTRDNGLGMISGQAGTGKSRTLQVVRRAYERQGHNVKGLAFTNKVAKDMQRDGFDSDTIAGELMRVRTTPWTEKTVIMVDEAAQISTKDLNDLFRQADIHKAKVILTGHDKQLGSIDKGGLFPVMEKRFGSSKLTQVMRTEDPDQKIAFNKMADRKFKDAIEIFKKSDSIRWNDTRDDSMKALTDEYAKDFIEAPNLTRKMIAPTNDDVDKLNLFARGLLATAGKIGPEIHLETTKGIIPVGVGDRLVMNETVDKKKGLVNGAFGTVTGIEGKQIEFQVDTAEGQPVKKFNIQVGKDKDLGEVPGISHGYASTVYKSQGDSIDRMYVFHDPRATAPSNYVALTRHIERVRLFITREETNSFDELAEQLKHGHDKTAAHSYLVDDRDRAKLDRPAPEEVLDRSAPSLAPEYYAPEPTPQVVQKETGYKNILRELFGGKQTGQAERGDLEDTTQRDTTEATKPGLFIKRGREDERSLER